METIRYSEDIPVVEQTDICILGGSCTGVFAAIRAARLGARVTIVERKNHFGGEAVNTCTWHSLLDTVHDKQIIAGLTEEVIDRLDGRDAVRRVSDSPNKGFEFRPGEMKLELDRMVEEAGVRPRLHSLFSGPVVEDGKLVGVIIDTKSGRGVVRAKPFVDATGDGDLCARLGLEEYRYETLLPPTVCANLDGAKEHMPNIGGLVRRYGDDYGLKPGFVWGSVLPGTDVYMLAGTRVRGVDCSNAEDLTRAEIEGRRQVGAIMELLRDKEPDSPVCLFDFPPSIGIRDTRHIRCQYQLTGEDVLEGRRFDDAIANGSYRVDTHHQEKPGITFMYLDGTQSYVQPGKAAENTRWREERETDPTFYQVPFRSLVPGTFDNLLLAGRMLDADMIAFSGVRVMVNTNQMGEAAGVAAATVVDSNRAVAELDVSQLRGKLADGGSIVI